MRKWSSNNFRVRFLATSALVALMAAVLNNPPAYSGDITIAVEAENSTPERAIKEVKYYLPSEIMAQHIVSAAGLKQGKDISDGRLYLSGQVEFDANEIKLFQIKVKDVWTIPTDKLDEYLDESKRLEELLKGTVYKELADVLRGQIQKGVLEIKASQGKAESIEKHIEVFRANEKKLESVWTAVDRLRELNNSVNRQEKERKNKEKIETILLMLITFLVFLTGVSFMVWITDQDRKRRSQKQ